MQFICRCTADGCNEKFGTKSNMKKHFERKHQNQPKQYVVSNYLCTVQWRLNKLLVYLVRYFNLLLCGTCISSNTMTEISAKHVN